MRKCGIVYIPTLQLNFVLLAVNQNGADRVEVVIVTAPQRAGPGLSYLEIERKRGNYWLCLIN